MKLNIILLFTLWRTLHSYLHFPFGSPFRFQKKEIRKTILPTNLPENHMKIIRKIDGFFGLIGPDIKIADIQNLYHLLLGNGIIQGCFFKNGELTFVKTYVKTDKLLYEEKCGKIPQNNAHYLIFYLFHKLSLLPNIFGLANTSIMKITDYSKGFYSPRHRFFALYERDLPYEIKIDFHEKHIRTIGRVNIYGVKHFSAHSMVHNENDTIETIDYNILTNQFIYHRLNGGMQLYKTLYVKTKYLPIIHDFISTEENIIFTDSPLKMEHSEIHRKAMPVKMMSNKSTYIHVLNKYNGSLKTFTMKNQSFYIFHYSQWIETNTTIEIYAPMYDHIDFSTLDIQGRYRKICIDKNSGNVTMEKNEVLENLDIEFPIKFGNKIIFRNMKNKVCDGFVICKDLKVIKQIYLENRFVSGEPRVIDVDGSPFLICFVFDTLVSNMGNGILLLINLDNYEKIEIPLNIELYYGFHSFFTSL